MPATPRPDSWDPEDPEASLREARARFMDAFLEQVTSAGVLAGTAAEPRTSKPLLHIIHQMAGLAGTVGFPTVSKRAIVLEQVLTAGSDIKIETTWIQACLNMLIPAFDDDRHHPPQWAGAAAPSGAITVLIAEDDPIQQTVIAAWLAQAGHTSIVVASGDQVLRVARVERPGLILLDIDLPVVDGYQVFWDLKASIEVATIPVMLMTASVGVDTRLTNVAVGADDCLQKPLEQQSFLMRIRRLLNRANAPVPLSTVLAYDAFQTAAEALLKAGAAAIAMVHVPSPQQDAALASFVGDLRKRDLVGRYDADHFVLALPGLNPATACARLRDTITGLRGWGRAGLIAGVASAAADRRLAPLVAEARQALAEVRQGSDVAAVKIDRGHPRNGRRPTVVLADDDLQIVQIVATRMRAAGYHTVLAYDGQQALEAVRTYKADLLVIDLTMPHMSGFDVLERLRRSEGGPMTIVLSGHRQSDDVRRASTLGADDYILKPFDPDDLMARVARLLEVEKAHR